MLLIGLAVVALLVVAVVVALARRPRAPHVHAGGSHECAACGSTKVGATDGLVGFGENATCLVLLALALLPGVIYYVVQSGKPYCSGHRGRILQAQMVPLGSSVDAVSSVEVQAPRRAPGFRPSAD